MTKDNGRLYKDMPRQVRIGSLVYNVGIMHDHDGDAGGLLGATHYQKCVIRVRDSLDGRQAANTFLHEVIHGIHWEYGVTDNSDEEFSTNQTTNGLCAFWQDNPKAVEWFTKAIRGHYD